MKVKTCIFKVSFEIVLDLIGHILHETHHSFVKQVLKKDVNFVDWQ